MPPLHIQVVNTAAERRAFVAFPWRVYRQDPHWVPPLFSEQLAILDPQRNPFFQHAQVELALALRGAEVVGTIAAFTNHRHNQFHEDTVGFFGFFEVLDDAEAAAALLQWAAGWAKSHGHTVLRGPAQFSTNDECGLLVEGFDGPPHVLMTYSPRRYADYLQANGFEGVMDLWAYRLDAATFADGYPEKLSRVADKVKRRHQIRIRSANFQNFDAELARVKQIYTAGWAQNWGFVPMTDAEFARLSAHLRPMLDPDLVLVAEVNGEPVGFSITLPDLNQPLRLAYPRPHVPHWWTVLKLAWHWKVRRRVTWVRVLAMGVLPRYRARGIDALLMLETAKAAMRKGYSHAEFSWILANNDMMNRGLRSLGAQVYRTYRFYEKALCPP